MSSRNISLFTGVLILTFIVMACTINIGGPRYPTPIIPISTEANGELQGSLQTAIAAGISTGQISLTFTESQLTSYLYYKLLTQPQLLISNPQVYLQNGQLQVFFTASKGYFEATARIILNAGIDEQGHLLINIASVDFGPVPVPNGVKEIVTATIQEAYTGALGPVATGFRLLSVTIANGTMTIVGQTK